MARLKEIYIEQYGNDNEYHTSYVVTDDSGLRVCKTKKHNNLDHMLLDIKEFYLSVEVENMYMKPTN